MRVIRTDEWLLQDYENPIKICKKLKKYFHDETISESDILNHLAKFGMYKQPYSNGKDEIKNLQKKKVWQYVYKEAKKLQTIWNGPSISVFILPVEIRNKRIAKEQNGKSGLAFSDKLFLFIGDHLDKNEIKALLTHEYNHICRLHYYQKNAEEFTLLDTIILEGLAENAVREYCGEDNLASWTTYYSEDQLEDMYQKIIKPNESLSTFERKHNEILYGMKFYPKMAGYCVGFYLVKNYMINNRCKIKDTLPINSSQFIEL
ncbi:DUF2268 domain-containing protein [Ornithinibacillus halophilus]|uniref:Uncharacterized protein YjaZ n=1 Tax=Ornithinibacillus halophilus TaxID=930117 RepID=A0A1M5FKP4_9BACI|nr:DUF2268 domain-containing protein [Ornithinibacillus halophilus]SHF92100.1 Uncharacterized protein YjaZ [Ornithinibacillus halophilus]